MSEKKVNNEQEDTTDGQDKLTLEQQVQSIGNRVFQMSMLHGNALDTMYLQLMAIVEILAEKKIITPELFEAKLDEVQKDIQKKIKEKMDEEEAGGQNNEPSPGGFDASAGASKIIVPDNKIIIP